MSRSAPSSSVGATIRRVALVALASVGLVALTLVTLGASAWLHWQQPVGRVAFGEAASALLSSQIPGRFRLEGVRRARLPAVEAERLRAESASGVEVMHLRDVSIELDLGATLAHAGPHIRRARVGGGAIQIAESPSGAPWIERAFSESSTPAAQGQKSMSSGSGGPFWTPSDREVMRIEDTEFEDLLVRLEAGGTSARLVGARGRARIWLPAQADVQMRFFGVSGQLRTSSSLLERADVRGLALTIDPTMTTTVRFAGRMDAYGAELTVAGHAPRRDGSGARVCMWTGGAPLASLLGVGGEIGTSLFTGVSFDMRPSDPPDDPRCPEEGGRERAEADVAAQRPASQQ